MPGWMRALASVNPVSHATDALRGAVLGTGSVADVASAVAAAAVMWLVVATAPTRTR
jgi:ABC-2 type transport system permease protein